MIRYSLNCENGHEFESWFASSDAYDKQVKRKLVTCPVCASAKVEKSIMAPRLARTDKGLGIAYTHPANLTSEAIDCYFGPLVSSPVRKEQFSRFLLALEPNLLVPIRTQLKEFRKPVRMVWATSSDVRMLPSWKRTFGRR